MPRILSSTLSYRQRTVLASRERCSRRCSSASSQCSALSSSAALTDASSSVSSLSSDFETMAMGPSHPSGAKPCIPRTKSSKRNLCNLDSMDESVDISNTRPYNLQALPTKHSVLNCNFEREGEWGQFVDVSTWLEDPVPPRAFKRSKSQARSYYAPGNNFFSM